MWLDNLNEFCDATALNTGAAASYLIGDQVDLGAAVVDIGAGEPLYFVVQADTAITSAATGTLQFHLASDAAAAMTPATASKHVSSAVFDSAAGIAAGTVLMAVAVPMAGNVPYERYLGVVQTSGTAAVTAGSVSAFLTKDVSKFKAYPDAI